MKNLLNFFYLITFTKAIFAVDPMIVTAFGQIDPESFETSSSDASSESDVKSSDEYFERLGITNYLNSLPDINPAIDPDIAEDSLLTTPQLVTKYKYYSEIHDVTTNDGYIIEMHRISGSPTSPPSPGKQPVFLMHGLLDSSATWVLMKPKSGLGYILADEGYDVWMGNARGNRYGRRHTKYDPHGSRSDRKKFWSFSWHEVGVHDLPTMIDYILQNTTSSKVHYVGHSQGTTALFVMCSELPDYNDKISLANALAPVAFMSHIISPVIRAVTPFVDEIEEAAKLLGVYEFLPASELFILGGKDLCRDKAVTQVLCENILFLIAGYQSDQLNHTMLPVILGHVPAGASTQQMVHYGQEVRSGHFRQFDYGKIENLRRYKSIYPPDYNLKNVRVKVGIHYAEDDWLATPIDVHRLADELPNVSGPFLVPHKKFNHIDFMWAIDVKKLVYDQLILLMKEVENSL